MKYNLTWTPNADCTSQEIYRSNTIFSRDNPPEPFAVLSSTADSFEDDTIVPWEQYYYSIGSIRTTYDRTEKSLSNLISVGYNDEAITRITARPVAYNRPYAGVNFLPDGMTVVRDSPATTIDKRGRVETVGNNILRPVYRNGVLLGWRVSGQSTDLMTIGYNMSNWTPNGNSTITRTPEFTEGLTGEVTAVRWEAAPFDDRSVGAIRSFALNGVTKYKLMFAFRPLPGNETNLLRLGPAHVTLDVNPETGDVSVAYGAPWIANITVEQINGFYVVKADITVNPADGNTEVDTVSLYNRNPETKCDLAIDFFSILDGITSDAPLYGATKDTDSVKTPLATVPGFPTDGSGFSMYWFGWTAPGINENQFQWLVTLDDGTTNNYLTVSRNYIDNTLIFVMHDEGSASPQARIAGPAIIGEHHVHMAATVQNDNTSFVLAVKDVNLGNGPGKSVLFGTDTNCTVPSGLTTWVDQNRTDLARPCDGITEASGLYNDPLPVADLMLLCDFP